MSPLDRTLADYKNSGLSVGPHIMKHLREELTREGVLRASDLRRARDGSWARIAGLVIGTANAVVVPDMFQRHRALIHTAALLLIEGPLQRVDDVIHVRARRVRALALPQHAIRQSGGGYRMRTTADDDAPPTPKSHDFR
jgi:error-prone DNA polymerase